MKVRELTPAPAPGTVKNSLQRLCHRPLLRPQKRGGGGVGVVVVDVFLLPCFLWVFLLFCVFNASGCFIVWDVFVLFCFFFYFTESFVPSFQLLSFFSRQTALGR